MALQLSRLELLDLIRQEIKENPILEESPDSTAEITIQETQITEEFGSSGGEKENLKDNSKDTDFDWRDYLYQEAKPPWDHLSRKKEDGDETRQFIERSPDKKVSLQDYLLKQLILSQLDTEEKKCGEFIIGNLDNNGYLTVALEELSSISGIKLDKTERILKEIQEFDPPGVAARSLKECLLLQLSYINVKDKPLVEKILTHHMTNLGSKKYNVIAKGLNVNIEDIIKAVKIINSLEPKPGRAFNSEDPQYINPDLFVYKIEGEYVVILNDDGMPKLHINSFYRQALSNNSSVPEESKEYIHNKLRSATWFIKSIYHRQNTVRNVMYSIIKFQREFFDKGIEYLKPLILREVAEDINMHESTVSRVTNNKYVHTSRGIFELKFFFNSSINSLNGDNIASESVKNTIRKIISHEDPRSPYSDQKIVKSLKTKNINIARRTVTKYREMMSILPSNKRVKIF
ncbi:MAG: RNA polymerase factor sigma-54 [Deltaproteobacteria bacterium]|nr:RNA polymerase factor sigma-54 [Deltaproteobacteria bacterium]